MPDRPNSIDEGNKPVAKKQKLNAIQNDDPVLDVADEEKANGAVIDELEGAVLKSSFDEVIAALDETQKEWAYLFEGERYTSERYEFSRCAEIQEKYAFYIPISEFDEWNTEEKVCNKFRYYGKERDPMLCYNFPSPSKLSEPGRSDCMTLTALCSDSKLSEEYDDPHFACNGVLTITVIFSTRCVVLKHTHKHHGRKPPRLIRMRWLSRSKTVEIMKSILRSDGSRNEIRAHYKRTKTVQRRKNRGLDDPGKAEVLDTVLDNHPGAFSETVEEEYDKYFNLYADKLRSDWHATIALVEKYSSEYAYYVFYNHGFMGFAIIYKNIIANLPKRIDSVGTHTDDHVSARGCCKVSAIANFKGQTFPLGNILIKEVPEVANEIFLCSKRSKEQKRTPIPSCEFAKTIDRLCGERFTQDHKEALVASFLILLYGTEGALCVNETGCHTVPNIFSENRVREPHNLCFDDLMTEDPENETKRFPGIEIPLFTIEDWKGTVERALNFTHPGVPVKYSKLKIRGILNKTLPKRFSISTSTSFFENVPFFKDWWPRFPRFPDCKLHDQMHCLHAHSPERLANEDGCLCCNLESEKPFRWVHFPRPEFVGESFQPQKDKFNNCTYMKLINLMLEHSRIIPMLPQSFPYLSEISDVPKDAQYYPADTLYHYILGDLFAFCSKYYLLSLLDTLWTSWYSPSAFKMWTQCRDTLYNVPCIDEAPEGPFPCTKARSKQISTMFSEFHELEYPKYLSELKMMETFDNGEPIDQILEPSPFVNRRSATVRFLARFSPSNFDEVPAEDYRKDCERLGTDVVMFVCGCSAYKKHNVHLCEHIARGITRSSFEFLADPNLSAWVHARQSPPFYVSSTSGSKDMVPGNLWQNLTFTPAYLNFWKHRGNQIIKSKGGRQVDVVFPASVLSSTKTALTNYLETIASPSLVSDSADARNAIPEEQLATVPSPAHKEEISVDEIIETCLNYVPKPYYKARADEDFPSDLEYFVDFAVKILTFEVYWLLDILTIVPPGKPPHKTRPDRSFVNSQFPLKKRRKFIREAQHLGVFENVFPRDLVPVSVTQLSYNYTRLLMDFEICLAQTKAPKNQWQRSTRCPCCDY